MELQGALPDTVRNSILLPLINETITALKSMADLHGTSDLLGYSDPLDVFAFKEFAVCISAKTVGGSGGKIIMNYDLGTAITIGNRVRGKMLGTIEKASVLNDEVKEALAEFSNTIIGLATRYINNTQHKISFGPPLYITNKQDSEFILTGVNKIYTVPIDIAKVGRFYCSYLLN